MFHSVQYRHLTGSWKVCLARQLQPDKGITMIVKISVIQQSSDSGFGGFWVLIAQTGSIASGQDSLFSRAVLLLFFFSHFFCSTSQHPPPRFCYVWVFLSFLRRWARPEALIDKLVYIGEINALQMRLNTYSKNADSAYRDYRPSQRAAARRVRLIHSQEEQRRI